MLLINTQIGQTISVGDHKLKVEGISLEHKNITASLSHGKTSNTFSVKLGTQIQLMEDVLLVPTYVFEGGAVSVSLGFDAPRSVTIRGDWFKSPRINKVSPLSGLNDRELYNRAQSTAHTPLEHALTTRMGELLDTMDML